MSGALQGKVAIVTGANQGLGLEIASRYVADGASVVICARNAAQLDAAHARLQREAGGGQFVEALPADIAVEADVARVVERTLSRNARIDVLVNNAGVHGPKGHIDEIDWQEWVQAVHVNVMGSVLMARAVLPAMKRQRHGKIIQLSGGGATKPMPRMSAYAVSKAGIVRFTENLAVEVQEYGIDVNALAPGAMNTRLLDDVINAGPEKVGADVYQRALKQKADGGAGFDAATDLASFLASSASDGISGKLISAIWDLWADWPAHRDELATSDAYTLRRITGRDRGFDWGDK